MQISAQKAVRVASSYRLLAVCGEDLRSYDKVGSHCAMTRDGSVKSIEGSSPVSLSVAASHPRVDPFVPALSSHA